LFPKIGVDTQFLFLSLFLLLLLFFFNWNLPQDFLPLCQPCKKNLYYSITGDTEVKGCVAALTFLLSNSVKFSVEASHLNNELQQVSEPN
jgi:hypothetical protein